MADLTDLKTLILFLLIVAVPSLSSAQVDPCAKPAETLVLAGALTPPGIETPAQRTVLLRSPDRIRPAKTIGAADCGAGSLRAWSRDTGTATLAAVLGGTDCL